MATLYYIYLLLIRNRKIIARKLKSKFLHLALALVDTFTHIEDLDHKVSENEAIMVVSFDSNIFGKIMYMNENASNLLGFSQAYHANTRKIFEIMTASVAEGHVKLLKALAENYEYKSSAMINTN
mgnify:CR=1 FL=1|jgi:hypothetical protein